MSDKIYDPAKVREAQARRVKQAAEERWQREEKLREQARVRDVQAKRLERQKETTAHYFKGKDGERQLRGAVRGEYAGRTDRNVVKPGFEAHANDPQKLKDTQQKQREFQLKQQARERQRQEAARAQRHKGKLAREFKDRGGR